MNQDHVSEPPVGTECSHWEHVQPIALSTSVWGSWTLHLWSRTRLSLKEWKCSLSHGRPFAWQEGSDTAYEAINTWMHTGE